MADDKLRLTENLEKMARDEGFAAFGIAPASLAPKTGKRLKAWLAEGGHGDMIWMESRANERADPMTLWPEVQSVIMLGMSYAPSNDPLALEKERNLGRISVYAQGKDYHDIVKKALKRMARSLVEQMDCSVKVFVDTAPLMEKPLAAMSGLGWQGKHTNLVSRDWGNWAFLGSVFTTLDLEADMERTIDKLKAMESDMLTTIDDARKAYDRALGKANNRLAEVRLGVQAAQSGLAAYRSVVHEGKQ